MNVRVRHELPGTSKQYRVSPRGRLRPSRRVPGLQELENRMLLSGGPTIYTVDSTGDTGSGTGTTGDLLYAVNQANANPNPAGSLIEFSTPFFSTPRTITLTSTLLIDNQVGLVTIQGPGANLVTVSGHNTVTVFWITQYTAAVLSGLTISGGLTTSGELGAPAGGGGVYNHGTLTLQNSIITNNTVGPAEEGGGVFNGGDMTISDCTITNNAVNGDDGGGLYNAGRMTLMDTTIANNTASGGQGGGLYNDNEMTLADSTVSNNTAGVNGGGGGGIYNGDQLLVDYSTIAHNLASGSRADGGGLYNAGLLSIPDSTVADNSADHNGGGIDNEDSLTAVNTTIADNSLAVPGGSGGGLFTDSNSTTLDNTIVAGNTGALLVPSDISGPATTAGSFNLIGIGGADGLTSGVNGNTVGVASPELGPLANSGGPTQTIALLPGSPAIDAGSNELDGLATDQRGSGYARIVNGTIDIGAFEVQPAQINAVFVDWGSAGTASLQTASDGLRLLPAGRNTDLPWFGINRLMITFNQPVTLTAAEVSIASARGINYGPVTVTGSGEAYTITLSQSVTKPDRVTITLAGADIATYTRRLDFLPGDFNDDGVVNKADAAGVRSEVRSTAPPTIYANILGDASVDKSDLAAVRKLARGRATRLRNVPLAALARPLAHERHRAEALPLTGPNARAFRNPRQPTAPAAWRVRSMSAHPPPRAIDCLRAGAARRPEGIRDQSPGRHHLQRLEDARQERGGTPGPRACTPVPAQRGGGAPQGWDLA